MFILPNTPFEPLLTYKDGLFASTKLSKCSLNVRERFTTTMTHFREIDQNDSPLLPSSAHTIRSYGNLLLIAGPEAAILHDGERWYTLFDKYQTEETIRSRGLWYDPENSDHKTNRPITETQK